MRSGWSVVLLGACGRLSFDVVPPSQSDATSGDGASSDGASGFDDAPLASCSTPNLIAWWTFDEGAGNTAVDSIGGHTATWVNAARWAAGRIGSAVEFTGTYSCNGGAWLTAATTSALAISQQAFSIAVWLDETLNSDAGSTFHRFVSWYDGTSNIQLGLGVGSGLRFFIQNDVADTISKQATAAPTPGWHHLVATFDGAGTYTIYVDGVVNSGFATTYTATPYTADTMLYLGTRGATGGGCMNGRLDDVRIYNLELSPADVTTLFTTGGCP